MFKTNVPVVENKVWVMLSRDEGVAHTTHAYRDLGSLLEMLVTPDPDEDFNALRAWRAACDIWATNQTYRLTGDDSPNSLTYELLQIEVR